MTLFRLEVLRMIRTHRWMVVVGLYGFFGVVGPLLARYLDEIIERFGGDVIVTTGEPEPVDGVVQFVSNAGQLGLLGVLVIASGALALDARPEIAAFLRTKVDHAATLVVPRVAVVALTAVAALVAGTVAAWVTTAALIGGLPVGSMIVGTIYGALYLVFVVAVVALMGALTRTVPATVIASLAVLLAFPLLALVPVLSPWLPSELLFAVAELVDGAAAGDFARSVAVTIGAIVALVAVAAHRLDRREL